MSHLQDHEHRANEKFTAAREQSYGKLVCGCPPPGGGMKLLNFWASSLRVASSEFFSSMSKMYLSSSSVQCPSPLPVPVICAAVASSACVASARAGFNEAAAEASPTSPAQNTSCGTSEGGGGVVDT
jgi:hypothetical protein